MQLTTAVEEYRAAAEARVTESFSRFLALDNVTGDVPALERNADEIVERLHARGCEARVVQRDGVAPIVVGLVPARGPARRRLGMYAHYDGQPVDPTAWTTPPFDPTIRDGRIYARGSADDKAPIEALLTAIDALEHTGIDRTTEVVVLFEGEEESGSEHLHDYLSDLREELAADVWLICDGPVHPSGRPQVVFGVRGYCGFDVTVYGPERELHSGHFGNWVPNPALDLARLLASCKDADGRVVIEGFYDSMVPITDADREAISDLPKVEAHYRDDIGFAGEERVAGSHAEALLSPSFNVRGLRSAGVGGGARNVIPTEATASVDVRLAAGNDPVEMLALIRRHFEGQGFVVLDREPTAAERRAHRHLACMRVHVGYPAARVPMDLPEAETIVRATEVASGRQAVRVPTFGGSVPLHHFEEVLGTPALILPIANYDNNQHAADENLLLDNLWYGVALWSVILADRG